MTDEVEGLLDSIESEDQKPDPKLAEAAAAEQKLIDEYRNKPEVHTIALNPRGGSQLLLLISIGEHLLSGDIGKALQNTALYHGAYGPVEHAPLSDKLAALSDAINDEAKAEHESLAANAKAFGFDEHATLVKSA